MKILIADDDPVTRERLKAILEEWGYVVIAVADGTAALDVLRNPDAPLLALVDWMMPGSDGVEVCRQVRAMEENRYTYLIVLTVKKNTQDIVRALDAGADDFLSKPFDLAELQVRIRGGRRVVELHEQLREQASHDMLTGLLNRRMILENLHREFARASREGLSMALMMVDLDHFKQINDKFGHQAGDEVLCEASRRIASAVRIVDFVGRYGGEEFLVVLPNCQEASVALVANRIREVIAGMPTAVGSLSIPVSASIGVAIVRFPSGTNAVDDLLRKADEALYRAKARGRDCVVIES